MDGITILNETISKKYEPNVPLFFITYIIVIIIAIVIGIVISKHEEMIVRVEFYIFGLFIGIVLGLIPAIIVSHIWNTGIINESTYEVTIDDNVSFVDFYNKYEIIDQKGKIYTIKEKDLEE